MSTDRHLLRILPTIGRDFPTDIIDQHLQGSSGYWLLLIEVSQAGFRDTIGRYIQSSRRYWLTLIEVS